MLRITFLGTCLLSASTNVYAAPALLDQPSANSPIHPNYRSFPPVTDSSFSNLIQDKLSITLLQYKSVQAKQVSLQQALQLAIESNPSLKAAADDVLSRGFDLKAAQQTWYPTLSINSQALPNATGTSTTTVDYLNGRRSSSLTSSFSPSVSITGAWNFLSPTRGPQINSASSELDADLLLFLSTARDLIFTVQSAYYQLQGLQLLIKDYNAIVDSSRQTYNAIYSKYVAGYANILQVEQVKSQLALNSTQLIEYHTNYLKVASSLAQSLGLPEFTIVTPLDPLEPVQPWLYPLDSTIALGLDNNEKISRSLALADSSKWKGYLEANSVLPSLSLNVFGTSAYEAHQNITNGTIADRKSLQNYDYGAYLSLEWRLFQGGTNFSRASSLFAQQAKFISDSNTQRDSVVSAIRSSFSSMTGNALSIESSRQAYHSAKIAVDASQMRYAAGLDDVTTIVQATQLLSQASLQQSNVIVQYNTNISNLYRNAAIWPGSTQEQVNKLLVNLPARALVNTPSADGR